MEKKNKIFLLIAGILSIMIGIMMFAFPLEAMQGISWLIGLLILIAGIALLIFYCNGVYLLFGSTWVLLDTIATIAVGILIMCESRSVSQFVPYLFGIWLFIMGLQELIIGTQFVHYHISQAWISILLGCVIMVLGFLCCWKPIAGSIGLSYLMGIGIILFGVSLLVTLGRINSIQGSVKKFFKALDD